MRIYAETHTLFFEGQKRAQNDGFGSKSSSRKSEEVRLGPEWAGHLPRCCGRANTLFEEKSNLTILAPPTATFYDHSIHSFGLRCGTCRPGPCGYCRVAFRVRLSFLEGVEDPP